MGLTRLKVEEADDQRGGEAEQRGGEGEADARERHGEPALEFIEHHRRVAAAAHAADHRAHRRKRLDQAPERAEQAEQDQDAGDVAQDLAALVEPHGGGVEMRAGARQRHPIAPGRDGGQQRREQGRPVLRVLPGGDRVDVAHLAKQPRYLPEGKQHRDQQHAEDQPVQARIGKEGWGDLLVEDEGEEARERQEHQHPHQRHAGLGEGRRVEGRGTGRHRVHTRVGPDAGTGGTAVSKPAALWRLGLPRSSRGAVSFNEHSSVAGPVPRRERPQSHSRGQVSSRCGPRRTAQTRLASPVASSVSTAMPHNVPSPVAASSREPGVF
ncbi:hypothetical protein M2440_004372 [Methylorubrum extorquens]|nr:hypothetical protein [Methylorubrum extorquens]